MAATHAAYFAAKDAFKRQIPGRIIGVSVDGRGQPHCVWRCRRAETAYIRREKATSNICTAQVLLAVIAGAYSVYPRGRKVSRALQPACMAYYPAFFVRYS